MATESLTLSDNPHEEGGQILNQLADRDPDHIYAAVSGGDDSIAALYFALYSPHIELDGILHVDTGIGVPQSREYVEQTAEQLGLECIVIGDENIRYPHESYEILVQKFGFPGAHPQAHSQIQVNLKDKPFNRFAEHLDGELALISGVRKSESRRRYDTLSDLTENGIQAVNNILWASPIVEFDDTDLKQYKASHDIPENMVVATLNSSGECLCAYEDRHRLQDLKVFYPEVARQICELEFKVLEQVARGEVKPEYALWCHGSVKQGEYDARIDNQQATISCADCEDSCGTPGYDQETGDPLSPAEAFLRENNLEDFWNRPFYCVGCDRVIPSPFKHRQEVHDWDAETGLEGYWDVRMVDLTASHKTGRIITEPNGYNLLHVNYLKPTREQATNRKHFRYYKDFALTHCSDHDHEWHDHNGGPVKQCSNCYAFDLSEYNPADPGPPILQSHDGDQQVSSPSKQEVDDVQQSLDQFTASTPASPPREQNPFPYQPDLQEFDGIGPKTAEAIRDAGYTTAEELLAVSEAELAAIPLVTEDVAETIHDILD
jgi:3'-phosphoadenosine 5'-phosphosulfate sulfotransferase (PAPS reductase)/FAD synthetase